MMSPEEYEKYLAFMNNKQSFRKHQSPEAKAFFYEQVKRRVVSFLEATGSRDLASMLAEAFWGNQTSYDTKQAMRQARDWGYDDEYGTLNNNPYFWYCLLKPQARKLANDAKAFTRHFDKKPQGEKSYERI